MGGTSSATACETTLLAKSGDLVACEDAKTEAIKKCSTDALKTKQKVEAGLQLRSATAKAVSDRAAALRDFIQSARNPRSSLAPLQDTKGMGQPGFAAYSAAMSTALDAAVAAGLDRENAKREQISTIALMPVWEGGGQSMQPSSSDHDAAVRWGYENMIASALAPPLNAPPEQIAERLYDIRQQMLNASRIYRDVATKLPSSMRPTYQRQRRRRKLNGD